MIKISALLPELGAIVERGNDHRRSNAVREIGALFAASAGRFTDVHIELFDTILIELIPDTEAGIRAELSERLAPLGNAPPGTVIRLARDDEIRVAGPVLRRSPLVGEDVLVDVARRRGQAHLLAIAGRPDIAEAITDIVIRRGDREVAREVAGNDTARLSVAGYARLIKRAETDGVLATRVGQRADISPPQLRELITGAVDLVRKRILATLKPDKRAEITPLVAEVTGEPHPQALRRDFAPAQRTVLALHRAGDLNEVAILAFAQARRYEECVAAIAAMAAVPIVTVDRLIMGERSNSILVLGRALDFDWPVVRALILLRQSPNRLPSALDIDRAHAHFDHLAPSTAQRVLQFWQERPRDAASA